jgi:hypothetical protein
MPSSSISASTSRSSMTARVIVTSISRSPRRMVRTTSEPDSPRTWYTSELTVSPIVGVPSTSRIWSPGRRPAASAGELASGATMTIAHVSVTTGQASRFPGSVRFSMPTSAPMPLKLPDRSSSAEPYWSGVR